MKRHSITPRPDRDERIKTFGWDFFLDSAGENGAQYWNEEVAYEFTTEEQTVLEDATNEVQERCLEAVQYVIDNPDLLFKLGIPEKFHAHVKDSWNRMDPSLYGRMDFAYLGGTSHPKLLEYNADTPTVVMETAVLQWDWLKQTRPDQDQFNFLHEALIESFRKIRLQMPVGETLYIIGLEELPEEYYTCIYLQDLAQQAGHKSKFLDLKSVGYNEDKKEFVDLQNNTIKYWFKLYPCEWLVEEEFGKYIPNRFGMIEPAWKMILSNKGILPILHQLFPDHPNILPASFDHPVGDLDQWQYLQWERKASSEDLEAYARGELYPFDYVSKPMLSREGANIDYYETGKLKHRTGGEYTGPRIYQEFAPTFSDQGHKAIIGSWIANSEACGIMVRDVKGLIVQDTTSVVPHWFTP